MTSRVKKTIYFSHCICYLRDNEDIRQIGETCSFPGIDREEAPAAESALIRKKRIPLASLHRASNVHGLTPLTVSKARFPEV